MNRLLLFEVGMGLLLDVIPDVVSNGYAATRQDESFVVDAKMIDVAEGQPKPERMTATEYHNKVYLSNCMILSKLKL